jgi:hypothetical protein
MSSIAAQRLQWQLLCSNSNKSNTNRPLRRSNRNSEVPLSNNGWSETRYRSILQCYRCYGLLNNARSNLGEWLAEHLGKPSLLDPRRELGSNTSTVTLRVVVGDKKGSLKFERVKHGHEYKWTRTRERLRWQRPVACIKDRPVFSSERARHKNKTVNAKQ